MKSVAKITVFLMAVTASEASRLGSPSEVSGGSSSRVVWTLYITVAVDIVVVLFGLKRDLPTTNYRCRR
jgi:hypothetical protein